MSTPPPLGPVASASVSTTSNKCFNVDCKDFKSRKGWRLNSGAFSELCDRCATAYEDGRFCETFHSNATGWRCCESCGKRVHCGCIVSVHAFTLLDSGGIECVACGRKNFVMTSKPAWPSSLSYNLPLAERLKDHSVKSWTQLSGSGPVPWHQAPGLFASSKSQSDLQPRTLYEVVRLNPSERLSSNCLKEGKTEEFVNRLMDGNRKIDALDVRENGNAGWNNEGNVVSSLAIPKPSSSLKEDLSSPQFGTAVPYASLNEANGFVRGSAASLNPTSLPSLTKQLHGNLHDGVESSVKAHIHTGRQRADARGRNQLLPQYGPRFKMDELQQISGKSNSKVTPLFEKMLSASDAGRIGRLVLPKKCAEAYLPPIPQPEGLPLAIQDSKGKEWVFQYRFWPNNNSRMYVLEGITPCLQHMGLQAGDIVTFSRLEPEGKLLMGCRKASTAPSSDQDSETTKTNGTPSNRDAEIADPSSSSKVFDKSLCIGKEACVSKSSTKRKQSSILGSKSKRLQIKKQDVIELKLTWKEAQGLICPPPHHSPNIVVIEGFEFEEYQDAPILGKPMPFATGDGGSPVSGAQELREGQLKDITAHNLAAVEKMKTVKQDTDDVNALERLDTQANPPVSREGEEYSAPSHATTKHSQHEPGCSCTACLPSPSGKDPKHKQTYASTVSDTSQLHFQTGMMYQKRKQAGNEAETIKEKQQKPSTVKLLEDGLNSSINPAGSILIKENIIKADSNGTKTPMSCFRGQIDLNIQPEREDEMSPSSDSGGMIRVVQDATKKLTQAPEVIEL